MNNEEKNNKLLEDLRNLPKVNAPSDFESKLWRKINSSEQEEKANFWDRVFSPGKLFPGAIAVAAAIIIFFIIDTSPEEMEDPLNLEPRVREDLIVMDEYSKPEVIVNQEIEERSETKSERFKKDIAVEPPQVQTMESTEGHSLSKTQSELSDGVEEEIAQAPPAESLKTEQSQVSGVSVNPAQVSAASNEIKKDNLNFMQINLSAKERQQVEQLKQRLHTTEKAKSE